MYAQHLTSAQIREYFDRTLTGEALRAADAHVAECEECGAALLALLPSASSWAREPEDAVHISYEQLEAYTDGKLETDARQVVEVHIKSCTECTEQVKKFARLRDELTGLLRLHPRTTAPQGSRPRLAVSYYTFGPILSAAVTCLVFAAFILPTSRLALNNIQKKYSSLNDKYRELQSQNSSLQKQISNRPAGSSEKSPQIIQDGSMSLIPQSDGLHAIDPNPVPAEVTRAFITGNVTINSHVGELKAQQSESKGEASPINDLAPGGAAVLTQQPTLHWTSSIKCASYDVTVFDAANNLVASTTGVTTTAWKVSPALQRGQNYMWAVTGDNTASALPMPPSNPARFRVLDDATAKEIVGYQQKYAGSSLTLGVLYANAGLIDDAERSLRAWKQQNPKSAVADKLLASLAKQQE
jgi:hypothetical protein